MSRSPGTLTVVKAILKISARRTLNRLVMQFRRRRATSTGPRRATAPRRSGWGFLALILYAFLLLFAVGGASRFLGSVSGPMAHPGRLGVDEYAYRAILEHQVESHRPRRTGEMFSRADQDAFNQALRLEAKFQAVGGNDEAQIFKRLAEQYQHRGIDGFYKTEHLVTFWPGRDVWPQNQGRDGMLRSMSVVIAILAVLLVVSGFSQYGRDLTAVHWSTEWFFTFPAPARAIFLADILQTSVLNVMAWVTVFPLMAAMLGSCGYGWLSPLPAAACTLYLSALAGAVCMLGETWMRRHFALGRLRAVQATCTVLTSVAFFALLIGIGNPMFLGYMSAAAVRAADSPAWVTFLPTSLPLVLTGSSGAALAGAAGMIALVALVAVAAGWLSGRLVQTGLVAHGAGESNRHAGRRLEPARAPLLRGVPGREVRLLLRDRNLLANAVILPVAITLMQLFLQYRLVTSAWGDIRHTAALAFGLGCYVILVGSVQVMASEVLWMLYTFPRGLEWVLLRKAALWAAFASLFAVAIMTFGLCRAGSVSPEGAASCVLAIWGVGAFAFINCGIGVLKNRLPQGHEKPRPDIGANFLCMILAGLYAGAIYTHDLSSQVVWAALFAIMAAAVWQMVRDRIGYLLDFTARPPPALGVAHGLVAAFAFFAIQGIFLIVLLPTEMDISSAMLISYALAGVIVSAAALAILRDVPRLLQVVGLARDPARAKPAWRALLTGLALGVAAGAAGVGYLLFCRQFPSMWREENTNLLPAGMNPYLLGALAVVAAPLVEEFIFRGLLFRGLERMGRPALAILGSAAVFAVIHPPISAAPVFVLGLAAAIGLRRTGLLLTPIIAHAAYNGIVLVAGFYLSGK